LILSTVLPLLAHVLKPDTGIPVWQILNWAVAVLLLTLLFAMIFKVLPDVELDWKDVWVGAFVTAVLFNLGTYLIGLYLGLSGATSAYGAAGSLVLVLLWVYYSSQILLFGAEFTRMYACRHGEPIVVAKSAVPLNADERLQEGRPAESRARFADPRHAG
jgi:membrane protein